MASPRRQIRPAGQSRRPAASGKAPAPGTLGLSSRTAGDETFRRPSPSHRTISGGADRRESTDAGLPYLLRPGIVIGPSEPHRSRREIRLSSEPLGLTK